MKNNSVNGVLLLVSFIVFAIVMFFIIYAITYYSDESRKYFGNYNKIVKNELTHILNEQATMDKKIKEIAQDKKYTLESPYIIENPYGLNVLSAIIIFNTENMSSVKIKINDTLVTTVEKSEKHIIPIYGLYANTANFIELELDDGTSKTIEIDTEKYNDNIENLTFIKNGDGKNIFLMGNLKSSNSWLRGFDEYNHLIFYIDFGYLSSIKHNINKMYVGYNSIYSRDTNLKDLNLEIDNLGRILSISTNTSELDNSYTVELGDKIYSHLFKDIYEKEIKNYTISKRMDNEPYSVSTTYRTKDLEESLINATLYEEDYTIAFNGEYITFDFENHEDKELLLVTRNTNYSYGYEIADKYLIKTNIVGDAAVYLKDDGEFYNLLTTIDN